MPPPDFETVRSYKPVLDGMMSGVHFGHTDRDVDMVFLHANGFHGRAFRSILEPVATQMNKHILALDLRGHGETRLPIVQDTDARFSAYARDFLAYLDAHCPKPVIAAGLSMGACASLIAASKTDKIRKVVAFDPVIMPTPLRLAARFSFGRKLIRNHANICKAALKRRDGFESYEAAFSRFSGRGPFKDFSDSALWDYVCGAFRKDKTGGVRLNCRPQWEAFSYSSQSDNMKKYIAAAPSNSHIFLTKYMKPSVKWISRIARNRPDILLEYRPELPHFFPLTEPDIARKALHTALMDTDRLDTGLMDTGL